MSESRQSDDVAEAERERGLEHRRQRKWFREAGYFQVVAVREPRDDHAERLLFRRMANFLDLLLEPDGAESAIGDLAERYRLRVETNPAHAKRWLIVQVGWLAFGRAMELLARFSAARAGK